jgi:hypothetical protein
MVIHFWLDEGWRRVSSKTAENQTTPSVLMRAANRTKGVRAASDSSPIPFSRKSWLFLEKTKKLIDRGLTQDL